MKTALKAGVVLALLSLFIIAGCTENTDEGIPDSVNSDKFGALKAELYHFHTNSQCYSCVILGELANETVQTYYKPQLESGKLIFEHVNIDEEENKELAEKYGAGGSSLMIGVYGKDGEFYHENLVGALYRLNDPESFAEYLKNILDPLIGGSS
ncbi:nitrophenyl compound nitroreductase subunit ArsF family protein [Methanoplanus limicola]|uniref:Thioredoxin domain-containing protein n=1 Tax=Methanoplanus limicola DSM 2279 TaxID=937775 RepID=H1Z1H3_9EURY|nr:nitrophenyl compound nitroreductase subunit ArsF family protein [Methanoplanus limicola]EHQ36320.1 hypothetical protein Metlim_2261 [Methanoplanus limicola DSM 2279]